jgi:hypothetical protein
MREKACPPKELRVEFALAWIAMEDESTAVWVWWIGLSAIATLNIIAWTISTVLFVRGKSKADPTHYAIRRWQVILAAGFVFGCAFRSYFPRADVQRICLYDGWISSVAIGRSVATIAELCFMAQASLYLYELASATRVGYAKFIARIVVPLICVAECFSWYATLTTNYIGNACEESIWATCAALLLAGFIGVRPRVQPRLRKFLAIAFVFIGGYIVFMTTVDVPMYISRWRADEAAQRAYFTIADGWNDLTHRWVFTHRWEDWHDEIPWMSLYFSVAVWFSIALARAPRYDAKKT